jgi:hypothetical protein
VTSDDAADTRDGELGDEAETTESDEAVGEKALPLSA